MPRKGAFPFKIENNILIGEEIPIDHVGLNVGELILNSLKSKPDFIGQVDAATGERNTFREMRERSVKCALWLKEQDVKQGDVVVLCTHNHLNAYIPFLATFYIGAVVNPWTELSVKASIKNFISQVVPKIIFVNHNKASTIREVATELQIPVKIVVFSETEGFESLESILSGRFDQAKIDAFSCAKLRSERDAAIILFSSGTTGLPKGVEISHTALVTPTNLQIPLLLPDDIVLWFGSLNWITSVFLTIRTMLYGLKAIKTSGFDKEKLCQLIEKYKVTWILLETSMSNHLFKSDVLKKYDILSLKRIVFGGSSIKHKVHEGITKLLPNVSIMMVYGTSETNVITHQIDTGNIGSNGYVAKNVRLMIADQDTGKSLGPNTFGEICVKCPALMNGYYKNPEETQKVIDNKGWFHTGDMGYYDENGDIFVTDRIKELIKYRGHQVSPTEIEILLQTHPAVFEAVVTPVIHPIDSQHPMAFVTKIPDENVTEEELKRFVAENLEDFKRLRAGIIFLEEMPRVPNGKIDRKELRNMAKEYVQEKF